MFDVLTYEKGCGVLRMLEQHIGPEVFRDGVRTYLKAHAYGNTVTSDLWDALEDASGAPGARRHGHVHPAGRAPAGLLARRRAQPAALRARDRCLPAPRRPSARSGACRSRCGRCPPTASRARRCATSSSMPTPEPIAEAGQGLAVVNAGGWGMFRVGYETAHRTALAEQLPELTPLERANLLADTWATTLAGHLDAPGVPGPGRAARRRARAGGLVPRRRPRCS